jgi:hypothetical protein
MHGPETLSSETALLAALRSGDEDAFSGLKSRNMRRTEEGLA